MSYYHFSQLPANFVREVGVHLVFHFTSANYRLRMYRMWVSYFLFDRSYDKLVQEVGVLLSLLPVI